MKLTIPFLNKDSKSTIEFNFSDAVKKGAGVDGILQILRVHSTNKRIARAVTKGKGAVSGGGRKPYRQKGTGRARQGSIRNPHFVGGGVAHGPRERTWSLNAPKKVSKNVFSSLLYSKCKDKKVYALDDGFFSKPSTAKFKELTEKLEYKNLLLLTNFDSISHKSANNLKKVTIKNATNVTVFDILKSDVIIFSASQAEVLEKRI